jgi:uncharacterized protein with PIN domain
MKKILRCPKCKGELVAKTSKTVTMGGYNKVFEETNNVYICLDCGKVYKGKKI